MKRFNRIFLICALLMVGGSMAFAAMQFPAGPQGGPGNPGNPGNPNGMLPPGPGPQSNLTGMQALNPNQGTPWYNPAPTPPPASNGIGWMTPSTLVQTAFPNPNTSDSGTVNVMACGYDAQGIWRVMPLRVTYQWNGGQYQVTVLNAWNPWTDTWNMGVDLPAYNTNYQLRGTTFDFYTVLSTGTFYFNL